MTKPLNNTTICAHVYADTGVEVAALNMEGSDTVTVRFGDYGSNITVFMNPANLRRLRDAIDAHLGDRETVEHLTADGDTVLVEEPA